MEPDGIDAATFQPQLFALSKTMIHLVERAGVNERGLPPHVAEDISMLLRFSAGILAHLYYIHAKTFSEDRDPHCLPEYTFVTLPQVRVLIDCLYNVTLLLELPEVHGRSFRADGYRQIEVTTEEIKRIVGDESRTKHLEETRKSFEASRCADGISNEEMEQGSWPTLSYYLKKTSSENADFLRRFSYGSWKQYSAVSHGTFWGLTHMGPFLRRDHQLPEDRTAFVKESMKPVSFHLLRATYVHFCTLCEVENRLRLGDHARVRLRLRQVWTTLADQIGEVEADVRAPFEQRYADLLALP